MPPVSVMTTSRQVSRAALWMGGAIASFSTMAIAGRAVSLELDTFEIMMFRSMIGAVFIIIVITVLGRWNQITTDRLGLHMIRNICHFSGQNLWFYALPLIPLAQVFALEFTTPLWVLLMSPILLGERLTRVKILAALIGFVGILIVARPSPDSINAGVITAALSAVGFAGSIIATKRLTSSVSILCILFYLTVMQSGFGLICAGFDGDIALPSLAAAPWLVLIALAGLSAHFCLTTALTIAPATIVVPLDFIRLPAIAVIGMLFYSEPLDMWVLVGAAIIFCANYMNIWSETR